MFLIFQIACGLLLAYLVLAIIASAPKFWFSVIGLAILGGFTWLGVMLA